MSRSYKKTPIIKYGGLYGVKYCKRLFNKRIRAIKIEEELPSNSYYRRVSEQWDLYDIRDYCSLNYFLKNRKSFCCEPWEIYSRGMLFVDLDEMPDIQIWRQCYLMK